MTDIIGHPERACINTHRRSRIAIDEIYDLKSVMFLHDANYRAPEKGEHKYAPNIGFMKEYRVPVVLG